MFDYLGLGWRPGLGRVRVFGRRQCGLVPGQFYGIGFMMESLGDISDGDVLSGKDGWMKCALWQHVL